MSGNSWQSGISGDWSDAGDWTGGTPAAGGTATIAAAGDYVVTLFGSGTVSALTLAAAGAEFYDAGALDLQGTLGLQAGTLALAYGAIDGGTLMMQGGSLLATGGTLDGVAVDGTLNLAAADSTLFVQGGLALAGANGAGAGSIALTGAYDTLDFIGSQSLNNATVAIGAAGSQPGQSGPAALQISHAGGATAGATLTLGASAWVRDVGGQALLVAGSLSPVSGAALADTLLNQGTITASGAGGTLNISGSGTFINQGTLAVSNGAVLEVSTAGLHNAGLICVNNAVFGLGGTFSVAVLSTPGSIQLSNAQVDILGTGEIGGGTLSVGAGSAITGTLGALTLAGTLAGGTIADAGGGLNFAPGTGTLSGVAYQGTLSLGTAGAGVTLANGTGVAAASITGNAACLLLQGNETLNNASIALGASGQAAAIGTSDPFLASSATTATLGPQTSVQQSGADAALDANGFSPFPGLGLSDTLVNQGTITGAVAGGTLSIGGYGTFLNQGTIAVSGGDTLAVRSDVFANAGTLSVGAGGVALLGGSGAAFGAVPVWSNAGQIDVTGGTLVLGGTLTTSQLGTVSETGGLVQLAGVLNNQGNAVTIGAGASLANVSLTGTVVGGTLNDTSGALAVGAGGTALLDGVSYNGTLALTQAGAVLRVRDGLLLSGVAELAGAGSALDFVGTQTWNSAQVMLGAAGAAASIAVSHDFSASGPSVLTLGSGLTVTQSGQNAAIGQAGGVAGDGIVNAGTLNAGVYGGTLTLGGPGFANHGAIHVSNGETLSIQSAAFSNTGVLAVSNAQLALADSLTLAALGQVTLQNASVAVSGTLALGGGRLAIGLGSSIGRLSLTGTLAGGTIVDGGQGLAGAGGADLSAITYDGVLDLSRPFSQLAFSQGLSVTGQNGSGAGTILLTGAASRLVASSTETLANCTVTLGSLAQTYLGQTLAAPELDAAAGMQLTIGATAKVVGAGTGGTLGDAGLGQWTDSIVNAGQITAGLSGGTLTLGSSFFTNSGTLSATGGGILVIGDTGFTNTGTVSIGSGSVAQLSLYNYFVAPVSGPAMLTNAGTIALSGSGILHEMTANGLFPAIPLANLATGRIIGLGAIEAPLSNAGTIDAHGAGTLSVQGSLTGTGSLHIDAGATLDLAAGVSPGQTASFTSSTGTLRLDQPGLFTGSISNLVGGDIIDLPGQTLTSLAISAGNLVVGTAAHQYHLVSAQPLAGALEAGRDGVGGATIAYIPHSGAGVGAGPTVLSVYQPNMLFWTTPSGDELQGTSAHMSGLDACNWSNASFLDITDLSFAKATLTAKADGAATSVSLTDGTHSFSVVIGANASSTHFTLSSDGHGGTLLTT